MTARSLLTNLLKSAPNKEAKPMSTREGTPQASVASQALSETQKPCPPALTEQARKASEEFAMVKETLIGPTREKAEGKTWVLPQEELKTKFSTP